MTNCVKIRNPISQQPRREIRKWMLARKNPLTELLLNIFVQDIANSNARGQCGGDNDKKRNGEKNQTYVDERRKKMLIVNATEK